MSRKQRMERAARERLEAAKTAKFVKIIACDFDGTLCFNKYPEIGAKRDSAFRYLHEQQEQGAAVILWTCRTGNILEDAVNWCAANGLYFDSINENLPQIKESFGDDPRKVFANVYLDDRAVNIKELK